MKLSRMAALLSTAVSRITAPQPSAAFPVSSGLLHSSGPNRRSNLADPIDNGNLRLSSSLQDFSTLSKLDPEESDLDHLMNSSSSYSKSYCALGRENAGSSFSKEKTLPAISFVRKKWVRGAMCLLCLLFFFFMIYILSGYLSTKATEYHVILDCGSTGTRVYVYEWSIDHGRGHKSLPIVLRSLPGNLKRKPKSQSGRAYHRMETEPGLHNLVHNTSGLRTALRPLLRWAEKHIPKYAYKSTSLFLYATAGVRRLPSTDSKWLLDEAWLILRNSSFMCQRHWVKVITGMEEAYFGWIALNYHMGTLGSLPRKPTYGALDLGGSSLQVTFENQELVYRKTSLNLSIGSVSHHLSAYSLSGYGLNDAFDKSVVHLFKRLSATTKVDLKIGKVKLEHPCLQTGYRERYICSHCAALDQEGSPLMGGRYANKQKSGLAIELLGAPNFEECSALAKITVNLSEWSGLNPGIDCELQPCSLAKDLPQPYGQFYAMSGFYVVFKFFNLTSEATVDDVLHKGQKFCETAWEVARSSVAPQPFIEQYCFRAPYIASLLREGLHITDNQVIVGSGSITWTLGVALLEAGRTLSSRMELDSYIIIQTKINPSVIILLVFLSLIILICALSCIGNWMPRFFRGPCLPLFRHNSGTAAGSVLNITSPFRFQGWSPIVSGDGKAKMPLSPTIAGPEQRPFGMAHGLRGSSNQLMESSFHSSVPHSYSSGSLGQMQFDNGAGSFWVPHRSQMQLQSRRSQSREDLSSSLSETHMVKV